MSQEGSVDIDISIDDDATNDIEQDMDEAGNENIAPTVKSTISTSRGKKRTKKERSKCWSHFDKLPIGKDGIHKCKCKYCQKEFSCATAGGTGHLLRHMKNCLKKDTRDISQMLLATSKGNMCLSDTFDSEKFRELLAAAITMHSLPFQFVEYSGIRTAFEYARPGLKLVSRNTVKADILKLYDLEKRKIKDLLSSNSGRVSLTSDLWTAINNDGYLALTVHFIDRSWILRKYILQLSPMPSPHTGVALANKIFDHLQEWGIIEKLSSLTLDNASANDVCVSFLKTKLNSRSALMTEGDLFHIRCCAHILNLIVQEGLKDVDNAVEKVRESIRYVKASQSRKEKFLECVKSLCLDCKHGLRQDVPTRWNSTFFMLKSAIYYKTAFEHLGMSESSYASCPTTAEWTKIERLCKFLGPYYDLTCLFSGTKYPTSNLFFPLVVLIYHNLRKESVSDDDSLKRMTNRMLGKFEKYWSSFNEVLAIAVVLDPRYKLKFVEWAYERLYGDDAQDYYEKIRKRLFDLFDEYSRSSTFAAGSSSSVSQMNVSVRLAEREVRRQVQSESQYFFSDFDVRQNIDVDVQKSELEEYLDEKAKNRTEELDILRYWSKQADRYPIISSMARDILCIPLTTVASESAFSCSGYIINRFRSSIKNENAEALICLRDWIWGEQDFLEDMEEHQKYTEDVFYSNETEENFRPSQGSNINS